MPELTEPALSRYLTGVVASVLERLGLPFLLLDQAGAIIFCNDLADDILAEGNHLERGGDGHLVPHQAGAAAALGQFLVALPDNPAEIDLLLEARDGGPPLFASLRHYTPPPLHGFAALPAIAVVTIRDDEESEGVEVARLRFNLTKAESDVVRAITAGRTITTYATERGLSVHTARKQLSGAMRKAGVSRQSQLTHLVYKLNGRGGK